MKLTQKTKTIIELLEKEINPISVYELIEKYSKELQEVNIDTKKINSANATLSSTTLKEVINKDKKMFNEKLVTTYKLVDNYKELIKEEVVE